MNNTPQRQREYALYRYMKALEGGDFETMLLILKQAEHDSILNQMITELSLADADTTIEEEKSHTHFSTNGYAVHVTSPQNGQPPKLDLIHEEKVMTTQTSYWQNTRAVSRRSNPLAAVAMIAVMIGVLGGILLANTPLRQLLILPVMQSNTAQQKAAVITADNLDRLTEVMSIPKDGAALSKVSFSPDSRSIAFEDKQQQIQLWNIQTQKTEQTFKAPDSSAQGRVLVFSPDGKYLAASGDVSVFIWNIETGATLSITVPLWRGISGTFARRMAFSQDGTLLYRISCGHSSDADENCDRLDVDGWDTVSGERKLYQMYPTGNKADGVLLPTDNRWGQSDANGQLVVRDLASGLTSQVLQYKGASVSVLAASWDSAILSVVDAEPSLKFYNARTSSLIASNSLKDQSSNIHLIAFSPNNNLLATIGEPGDQAVQFWNVKDGKKLDTLNATESNHVFSVTFSPDGTLLMTDSNDGNIRIWGVASGS